MRSTTGVLALVAVLAAPLGALPRQATSGAAGHWEGALQIPAQELQVAIDLAPTADGKKWEGTIAIPAQGLKNFPLADIVVTGESVSFAMPKVPGSPAFKGTVSKDGKSIAGDFTQGGGTVPFKLTRTGDARFEPLPKSTPITTELEGNWEGALDIQGTVLRLLVKLARQPDGTGAGTLVSVDQGGAEISLTAVVQKGTHVTLLAASIGGTFEGELKEGGLSGTWTQGPGKFPLALKRVK